MRQVSVVGNSGSGKATLGRRVAVRLGVPFVEFDSIRHLASWQELGTEQFIRRIDELTAEGGGSSTATTGSG